MEASKVSVLYINKYIYIYILGMWMQRGLYGKILLLNLEFLTPSFQITGFNLIVKLLGGTAMNWVLGIYIQHQLILREMGRLRLLTRL